MNAPARVGLVGCGVISHAYAKNAAAFDSFEIVACADRDEARSMALAAEHGLDAVDVESLLADAQVDVVLNLTPPAAHAAVTLAALEAGKHVYSEKPLGMTAPDAAELLALADARGLPMSPRSMSARASWSVPPRKMSGAHATRRPRASASASSSAASGAVIASGFSE